MVPIDARAIDHPNGVGPKTPPGCRIVVAHPVLVQPGFAMDPLAGEAEGDGGTGGGADLAEGQVAGVQVVVPVELVAKTGRPMWSTRM